MNSELLFLTKKHVDTLIEQTITRPEEVLEFQKNKQMENFSLNPPTNLVEGGKWLLGVTSFERTNSVFSITNKNNSFLISTTVFWSPRGGGETIHKLQKKLKLRSQIDNEFHVKIRKRVNQVKIGNKE